MKKKTIEHKIDRDTNSMLFANFSGQMIKKMFFWTRSREMARNRTKRTETMSSNKTKLMEKVSVFNGYVLLHNF